jgi:hypothetical protein
MLGREDQGFADIGAMALNAAKASPVNLAVRYERGGMFWFIRKKFSGS